MPPGLTDDKSLTVSKPPCTINIVTEPPRWPEAGGKVGKEADMGLCLILLLPTLRIEVKL